MPLTIYRPRQIYVGEGYRDYVSRRGERSAELRYALQAGGARRLPARAGYSEMPGEQIVLDGGIRLTGIQRQQGAEKAPTSQACGPGVASNGCSVALS